MEIGGITEKRQRTAKQVELAQYFTPPVIASYMASMFDDPSENVKIRLLDPGAGEGILGMAAIERLKKQHKVDAHFVELDPDASDVLKNSLALHYKNDSDVAYFIEQGDYIEQAIEWYSLIERFTHIIINPPYFKLRTNSKEAIKLRQNDVSVTNIYAAFIWISVKLLEPDGELVAIVPRSFCNGPYFLKFREYILQHCSLEKIHVFNARDKAFSGDGVLQENVIIHLKKQKQSPTVKISYSTDHGFSDLTELSFSMDQIIHPNDEHKVIHIPSVQSPQDQSALFVNTLSDTGINVSTGPVVDFRLKDYIFEVKQSDADIVPLIYPAHIRTGKVAWPVDKINKKGQYFSVTDDTRRWVVPLEGYHVIVRRFSSKEERRRIFAAVVDPSSIDAPYIAYENHVNFFHINKAGLDKELALGLWAFLNSKVVDDYFRSFSGHTQVNVSDLKRLRYPRVETLRQIGAEIQNVEQADEQIVNEVVGRFER
jgi:adenine-specific DNA-methyltransferase